MNLGRKSSIALSSILLLMVMGCQSIHAVARWMGGPDRSVRRAPTRAVSVEPEERTGVEFAPEPLIATSLRARARLEPLERPPGWPTGYVWRPVRHFGPLIDIGDTSKVQVHISGTRATWYFNDFFATCPDASWCSQYFSNNLPTDETPYPPVPPYEPGEMPDTDGLHDVLFALDAVRLTSHFGGSVELKFVATEDYEFEVRSGQTIWDLASLEMAVYVPPWADAFNRPHEARIAPPVGVVLNARDPIAYEVGPGGRPRRKASGKAEEGLQEAFRTIETSLIQTQGLRPYAIAFVHGLLHGQLQNEIGTSEIVTMIEISEGFVDVHTEVGTPMFSVDLRLNPVIVDSTQGLKNVTAEIGCIHDFLGLPLQVEGNPYVCREFAFASGESNSYVSYGLFDLASDLKGFYYFVEVTGWGGVFTDPRYDGHLDEVPISRQTLEQRAAATQWGIALGPISTTYVLRDEDGAFGSLTVQWRVRVMMR